MEYEEVINQKRHKSIDYGIYDFNISDKLFDFQRHVAEYAIKKGRCAIFLDTGLGKTIIELTIADNYAKYTNKPVLIITPLAVAFQFIKEHEKFNMNTSIMYSKDGKYNTDIVICNYERLDKFNCNDFSCVILDESSILKNFDGKIKHQVTLFLRQIEYRFLATATPSPNDFIELGTSSEALGYLPYMEMMRIFFGNNENNIRPQEIATKWYLKPHAENDFFNWVSSWSISMRTPSDLGYNDEKFQLPDLIINDTYVKNTKNWIDEHGQLEMFPKIAKTMTEVRQEQKMTIENRCQKAVELSKNHDISVYWCNFNDEGNLLQKLDDNAYQICGSMNLDKKEDILLNFANGNIKKLITKPKITAFGLNWQHCNHTVYFPTWSYEQYYQAIRRFWRFGQELHVYVDRIFSDGQKRVEEALNLKVDKANQLFKKLNKAVNNTLEIKYQEFKKEFIKPYFYTNKFNN